MNDFLSPGGGFSFWKRGGFQLINDDLDDDDFVKGSGFRSWILYVHGHLAINIICRIPLSPLFCCKPNEHGNCRGDVNLKLFDVNFLSLRIGTSSPI